MKKENGKIEKIKILNPLNKSYLITFVNSLVGIHFFTDTQHSEESLKNLLFPINFSDENFYEFVNFIKIIFDEMIRNNNSAEHLKTELSDKFIFEVDLLDFIAGVITSKKTEILNELNNVFNEGNKFYKNINWSIKSILSASNENHFEKRTSDVEFIYVNISLICRMV